jgi:putative acetyltransferase
MALAEDVWLRPAVATDFAAWFALYERVAREGRWIGGEAPVERAPREERFLTTLAAPDEESFVALAGEGLVGSLGLQLRRGVVSFGVQVDPAWRRRGVASALLTACLDWARAHEAHKVTLEVWPHNAAAIALYHRFGFSVEGRLRRHYRRRNGELWDALAMGLVLDADSPGSPHPDPAAGA